MKPKIIDWIFYLGVFVVGAGILYSCYLAYHFKGTASTIILAASLSAGIILMIVSIFLSAAFEQREGKW